MQSPFYRIFTEQSRWRQVNEQLCCQPHIALEQDTQLLKEVASGKRSPIFRVWETTQCLVVTGKETRFPHFDKAAAILADEGWPVIVRNSGGTSVPLHPGILNLSMIFPQHASDPYSLDDIYMALCEPIKLALESVGLKVDYGETPGSYCDGRFNLNIGGLKVTGTAQKLMVSPPNSKGIKQAVLAQAMLMVEADAASGTGWVNRFYQLAGNDRQFDPLVATSIYDCIGKNTEHGELTTQLRKALFDAFEKLIS
ncbi:lipoate--protein ligase family protein [Neptuniibacter caesariensis]|uniref:BPL/LPL catalytic domain-containing protein n=1 Tax=Neptuniibacter caesariensis TaxID=207954 RepID=A0A7U8C5W3_NEPCE|nr:hypothetical protein [Neptuniibacter caesariensis]EAR62087.1 hypothetical protein MED92_10289 [Oceanospirillum sp. MED92] [Neptuniibacter caesariensis]